MSGRRDNKKIKVIKSSSCYQDRNYNNNFDAWFIGFHQFIIGVCLGFDNPTLEMQGKFKAALPVFKDFVENTLFLDDFDDFGNSRNIYLTSINYDTDLKSIRKIYDFQYKI